METSTYPVVIKSSILGLFIILSIQMYAQERVPEAVSMPNSSDTEWKTCISPFFELLGKGWFSLNVDFRIKENFAVSAGIAAIEEEGLDPNVMGYYFAGKRHRFEMGGGLSAHFKEKSLLYMYIHGVIGYRYQKKRGLLFRAGFTPMFVLPFKNEGKFAVLPFPGISLGYSF